MRFVGLEYVGFTLGMTAYQVHGTCNGIGPFHCSYGTWVFVTLVCVVDRALFRSTG